MPAAVGEDLYFIRDYILESLELGVLVVGQGVSWEIADLPDLGGVSVKLAEGPPGGPDPAPAAGPETAPKPGQEKVRFKGAGAAEKQRIYQRLLQWRRLHGLGSLQALVDAGGGRLTEETLRTGLRAGKLELDVWRQIDRAISLAGG